MPDSSSASNINVDINQIATDLNGKADTDLSNASPVSSFATLLNNAGIRTVVETYHSGTEWYRIWSDGWCEQGGQAAANTSSVTFLKEFTDTNYYVTAHTITNDLFATYHSIIGTKSTTGFTIASGQYASDPGTLQYAASWEAKGYIS